MEHGIVTDWNDMERIWQYIYSKDQLKTSSEEVRGYNTCCEAGACKFRVERICRVRVDQF